MFLSDAIETGKRNFFVYADFSWDAFPVLEPYFEATCTLQRAEEKNTFTRSSGTDIPKEYWTLMTTYKSVVDTSCLSESHFWSPSHIGTFFLLCCTVLNCPGLPQFPIQPL